MSKADEPAFPEVKSEQFLDTASLSAVYSEGGLTKREYFAAMAMQGMLACLALFEDAKGEITRASEDSLAKASVLHADALLEELNREKSG